jgi:hypothetical protein
MHCLFDGKGQADGVQAPFGQAFDDSLSDVCYVGLRTPGGAKYFQLIQDEASRFKWVYMIAEKSEATLNVIKLVLHLEKEHVIQTFSCDQWST